MAPVTTTYTVKAVREGVWWVLHVEDVGVTQSRSLRDAPRMAADMIALMLDVDPETIVVQVEPQLDEETMAKVKAARAGVAKLEAQQNAVAKESRAAALKLRKAGLSGADAAKVLGVSQQRVSQLLATKS
uniref:hypothetical protein n=1 Tax=Promicromonospora sp. CA-289581 TaxID=3240013 RepID=UPI003F496221